MNTRPQEFSPNGAGPTDLLQRFQDGAVISSRLAHSFDNILTGIIGFSELSMQMLPSGSPVSQYLGEVLQAAQNGVVLTQQLHHFGRASTVTAGPTQLAVVVADEESRVARTLPPSVTLKIDLPADLPSLAIGIEALRQVIGHLLDNAREATAAGTITLSAREAAADAPHPAELPRPLGAGPFVEITVADTGSGMTPEASQRLATEPFFTSKARHSGLGLPTVQRILRAHGGAFRLSSVPGEGTSARVFLPPLSTDRLPKGETPR